MVKPGGKARRSKNSAAKKSSGYRHLGSQHVPCAMLVMPSDSVKSPGVIIRWESRLRGRPIGGEKNGKRWVFRAARIDVVLEMGCSKCMLCETVARMMKNGGWDDV